MRRCTNKRAEPTVAFTFVLLSLALFHHYVSLLLSLITYVTYARYSFIRRRRRRNTAKSLMFRCSASWFVIAGCGAAIGEESETFADVGMAKDCFALFRRS